MTRIASIAVLVLAIAAAAAPCAFAAGDSDVTHETSAPRRTRVTVYPRTVQPGPSAIRHCDAWLVKEYRVSGPVIVPQMRCVWR